MIFHLYKEGKSVYYGQEARPFLALRIWNILKIFLNFQSVVTIWKPKTCLCCLHNLHSGNTGFI